MFKHWYKETGWIDQPRLPSNEFDVQRRLKAWGTMHDPDLECWVDAGYCLDAHSYLPMGATHVDTIGAER